MAACTIVVPTRDRPALLTEAVDSALVQDADGTEVLVVDDGSLESPSLPAHPRLRVVHHLRPRGVAAARNLGISLARTPYVAFLDDDDRLRAGMVTRSLEVLATATAPAPVAVVSAMAVTDDDGRIAAVRRPPRLRTRGAHYSLEPLEPGRSYFTKQTLVAPTAVLRDLRGFDESFRSRVVTELFWRLNEHCSIVGFDDVTYEQRVHAGPRISTDPALRQASFARLVATHRALLRDHPEGYAELLAQHVRNSLAARQQLAALRAAAEHARVAPRRTLRAAVAPLRRAPR